MLRYSAIRILLLIPIIICVTFIIYWLVDLAPGTIVDTMINEDMTEEDCYYGTLLNIMEMFQTGTTCFVDMNIKSGSERFVVCSRSSIFFVAIFVSPFKFNRCSQDTRQRSDRRSAPCHGPCLP